MPSVLAARVLFPSLHLKVCRINSRSMLASLCPINRTIHARSFAENSNDAGGQGRRSNVSSVEWLGINASTNFGVMPYNPHGGCLDLVNNTLIKRVLSIIEGDCCT